MARVCGREKGQGRKVVMFWHDMMQWWENVRLSIGCQPSPLLRRKKRECTGMPKTRDGLGFCFHSFCAPPLLCAVLGAH